jgi:hypothetical protein
MMAAFFFWADVLCPAVLLGMVLFFLWLIFRETKAEKWDRLRREHRARLEEEQHLEQIARWNEIHGKEQP